jgi:signal transduction histidine kinase
MLKIGGYVEKRYPRLDTGGVPGMALDIKLDTQALLDGLGHGILIFDSKGHLVLDNLAARTIMGSDLRVIRAEGWKAAAVLFDTRLINPDDTLEAMRKKALESERPVRFRIYRSGEYVPCWAAAIHGEGGAVYTMITLDVQDWTALTQLIDRFRLEIWDAVEATQGHISLITQTFEHHKPEAGFDVLNKRVSGFTRLIATHMHRNQRLLEMLEHLEAIRTGALPVSVREQRRKIDLMNYMEDFVEELDEITLVDPETEAQDMRSRVATTIPEGLAVQAAPNYLTRILREMLRNAIMYSLKATPIKIEARVVASKKSIQLDMIDQGYGVRQKEFERVFLPFQRARQPQIIAEFGYGLSLYLCKYEAEAMNGRLWFQSEEGVGSTFSLMLPMWRDDSTSTSSNPKVTK